MGQHSIVHVDIPAEDRAATAQFYGQLFGWELDHSAEEFNYTMFRAGDGPGGGFPSTSDGYEAGSVLIYVSTDDIDESLSKAVSLGGKTITPRTEIPGIGWFGIFADPSGNNIGLYTDMGTSR